MRGGEGDCCVVVVGAGAAGALTASHLVTGSVLPLPDRTGRPVPHDGPRPGVLHDRRPPPAQRAGERDERVPARPRALLPMGAHAPRPRDPAAGLRPPPGVRRLRVRPAADRGRVPRQRPTRAAHGVRARHRPSRRPVRGPPLLRPVDRRPRRRAGHRLPARHRLGARRPRLVVPAGGRPVDPGAARRRPAAGRHRPHHGRPRHLRRPPRPHAAHGLAPRPRPRRCTGCPTTPAVPPPPGITRIGTLDELSDAVDAHVAHTVEDTGDWRAAHRRAPPRHRPALAGAERRGQAPLPHRPLPHAGACTATGCHRSPPAGSREIADAGRLVRHTGTLVDAREVDDGIEVDPGRRRQRRRRRRRQLHRSRRRPRRRPAARGPRAHRPGPTRSGRARHRHRRRRSRPRRTPDRDAALRHRHPAPRQPVRDHGDARDPRAGLRRRARRRTRAARGDQAPPDRRLRAHPHHQPSRGRDLQRRASAGCCGCRTASRRVWRQRSSWTPTSRRRRPHSPCSATSGAPPVPGARRCATPTRPPPSVTSTTARPASSTP